MNFNQHLNRDIHLPNFIRRCLNRSAKASSSLGSVSVSGCSPAAATAAAMAGWWDPGWPWCPVTQRIVIQECPIQTEFGPSDLSKSRKGRIYNCLYLTSGSPRDHCGDGQSCGSCRDRNRVAGGARTRSGCPTWAWEWSWIRLGPACPTRPSCDASGKE